MTTIIRDLSDRLVQEAAAEASHKVRGACDLRIGVILFWVRLVVFFIINFFCEAGGRRAAQEQEQEEEERRQDSAH